MCLLFTAESKTTPCTCSESHRDHVAVVTQLKPFAKTESKIEVLIFNSCQSQILEGNVLVLLCMLRA